MVVDTVRTTAESAPAPTKGVAVMSFSSDNEISPPAVSAQIQIRLWPVPASCGEARRAVRDFCRDNAMSSFADDAELLTSEVVGNAVTHSATLITLIAMASEGALTVAVRDDDVAGVDREVALTPDMAERGRGLFVVDNLAAEWGTSRHDDGKSVWFRLPRAAV